MKKILTVIALAGATMYASAQGTANFVNSGSTLISAGGTTMSRATNAATTYYFAVFLAPSTTIGASGQSAALTAPEFQLVGAYNTNSGTANGALLTKNAYDIGTTTANGPGSTVDFIVRGWSANAGATWAAALAFWNNGTPAADMYIGSSTIGNNILLGGGAIGNTTLFGAGAVQITGFNMALVPSIVPEPTSMALAGLGAASLLMFRRRK